MTQPSEGTDAAMADPSSPHVGLPASASATSPALGSDPFALDDAMGDKPPTDTYVGMVRANVRTVVEALR